jgi:butyrate response factor
MEALVPAAAHHAAFGPKPFGLGDGRFSSSPNLLTYGGDRSTHPSCRGPVRSASTSPRASSDTDSVVDEGDHSPAARLARLALQYQEAANRYQLCFSHLANISDEAMALRRENHQLRFANAQLVGRIAMVGGKHSSAIALADDFRRLTLAEEQSKAMPPPLPTPPPPPAAAVWPGPAVMPKSISVRSTGYIKMNPSGNHRAGSVRSFCSIGQSTSSAVYLWFH